MREVTEHRTRSCRPCSRALTHRVGLLAGRLAALLEGLPSASSQLHGGLGFLRSLHEEALAHPPSEPSPRLVRLREGFGLTDLEEDALVLAGMPEEHEGLASVLATLHPEGEPRPTPGIAAQLLAPGAEGRVALRDALETGPLHHAGLVERKGSGPFFNRSLTVGPGLWSALQGRDVWPDTLRLASRSGVGLGLASWLGGAGAPGVTCLAADHRVTVLLEAEGAELAVDAAAALARSAERRWALMAPANLGPETARSLVAHAAIRGVVPILVLGDTTEGVQEGLPALDALPGSLLLVGAPHGVRFQGTRPVLRLPAPRGAELDRRAMWETLLPGLGEEADELASCLRLPPGIAAVVAGDAGQRAALDGRTPGVRDVTASLRGRVGTGLVRGARIVRPTIDWNDLVLGAESRRQLEEAGDRLRHQNLVLDRWELLRDRPGARGVRILLHGPPGTGKTLAAEALAGRVGVDLLVVDLSQVVSKWIGETEKNLGGIFDAAEEAQSVLLFDEADALFAQRTEVGDARDRYANLETSYLLTRLERFEGLAVLSTNIKRNIDTAFLRRLDFVVEFPVPSADHREAIWMGHVPDGVPRAPDVCFRELADRYPVAGGVIRNAALGAAFLAAANGQTLTRDHLSHSIRREYAKAGLAFPGPLPGTAAP